MGEGSKAPGKTTVQRTMAILGVVAQGFDHGAAFDLDLIGRHMSGVRCL
jgi:hypothetical protein